MRSITIRQQRGINLLELILAIALCGMALLAVVGVQWRYHKAFQQDERRLQARAIASSLMSEFEAGMRTNFDADWNRVRQTVPLELDSKGEYQYECTESIEDGDGNLKRLQLEIFWTDKRGGQSEKLWCIFLRGE